jgi:hypothetical protein
VSSVANDLPHNVENHPRGGAVASRTSIFPNLYVEMGRGLLSSHNDGTIDMGGEHTFPLSEPSILAHEARTPVLASVAITL